MKKVYIKSVYAKYFKAFKLLQFDVKQGIYFIEGVNKDEPLASSNGSAKSTIFDALYYGLLGGVTNINTSKADDILSNFHPKDCEVHVELEVDNDQIKISRYRNHSEFKTSLKLFLNGQDISTLRIDSTQDKINQLVFNDNHKILKTLLFLTSGIENSFTNLNTQSKIEIIEKINSFDHWNTARAKANAQIRSFSKEVNDYKLQISKNQGKLDTLNSIVVKTQNQLNALSSLDTRSEENKKALLSEEIKKLEEARGVLKPVLIPTVDESYKNTYTEQINSLKSTIESNKVILKEKVDSRSSKVCPTCNQVIKDAELESSIDTLNNQIKETTEKISTLNLELLEKDKQVLAIKSQYQAEKSKYDAELSGIENQINQKKSEISRIDTNLSNHKSNIEKLEKEIFNYNTECQELETSIKDLDNKINETIMESSYYEYFYNQLGPRGNLRPFMLKKSVGYLNKVIKEYSSYVLINSRMEIRIENTDNDKSVNISEYIVNNITEESTPVSKLSSGERRKLDIVVQLALLRVIKNLTNIDYNILVLDEVFNSVDYQGVSALMSLINEIDTETIYIISHNPDIKQSVPPENIITVEKENGISEVINY